MFVPFLNLKGKGNNQFCTAFLASLVVSLDIRRDYTD